MKKTRKPKKPTKKQSVNEVKTHVRLMEKLAKGK
jgi:hypothetical protein